MRGNFEHFSSASIKISGTCILGFTIQSLNHMQIKHYDRFLCLSMMDVLSECCLVVYCIRTYKTQRNTEIRQNLPLFQGWLNQIWSFRFPMLFTFSLNGWTGPGHKSLFQLLLGTLTCSQVMRWHHLSSVLCVCLLLVGHASKWWHLLIWSRPYQMPKLPQLAEDRWVDQHFCAESDNMLRGPCSQPNSL